MLRSALEYLAIVVVGAVALEAAYRGYLYLEFPDRFTEPSAAFFVHDQPLWAFDRRSGYKFVPSAKMAGTYIAENSVAGCFVEGDANANGNIGPLVSDFADAPFKVAVYGDSFTASALDGQTWPSMLQHEVENFRPGARVINMARDGFGVLQIVALAADTLPELQPDLAVFAFNSGALTRARVWRTALFDQFPRFVMTNVATQEPPDEAWSDMLLINAEATADWCQRMLKNTASDDDRRILDEVIERAAVIRNRNATTPAAVVFDLQSSYVFNRLVTGDAFHKYRPRERRGINPYFAAERFSADPQFRDDIAPVLASGVPVLLVHLPMGVSLRDSNEFWFDHPNSNSLLSSLEEMMGTKIHGLKEAIGLSGEEAMSLCKTPDNCHPSIRGMHAYASAVADLIRGR